MRMPSLRRVVIGFMLIFAPISLVIQSTDLTLFSSSSVSRISLVLFASKCPSLGPGLADTYCLQAEHSDTAQTVSFFVLGVRYTVELPSFHEPLLGNLIANLTMLERICFVHCDEHASLDKTLSHAQTMKSTEAVIVTEPGLFAICIQRTVFLQHGGFNCKLDELNNAAYELHARIESRLSVVKPLPSCRLIGEADLHFSKQGMDGFLITVAKTPQLRESASGVPWLTQAACSQGNLTDADLKLLHQYVCSEYLLLIVSISRSQYSELIAKAAHTFAKQSQRSLRVLHNWRNQDIPTFLFSSNCIEVFDCRYRSRDGLLQQLKASKSHIILRCEQFLFSSIQPLADNSVVQFFDVALRFPKSLEGHTQGIGGVLVNPCVGQSYDGRLWAVVRQSWPMTNSWSTSWLRTSLWLGVVSLEDAPLSAEVHTLTRLHFATESLTCGGRWGERDPRLFNWQQRQWILYNAASPNCTPPYLQYISPIGTTMPLPSIMIRYPSKSIQKNFVPFTWREDLYFSYRLEPHQVLRVDQSGMCTKTYETSSMAWRSWHTSSTELFRGGTPHLLIRDQRNDTIRLAVGHIVQNDAYIHFAYKMRYDPPFDVLSVSRPLPLSTFASLQNHRKKIAFASGLVGAGDRESRTAAFSLTSLENYFRNN